MHSSRASIILAKMQTNDCRLKVRALKASTKRARTEADTDIKE